MLFETYYVSFSIAKLLYFRKIFHNEAKITIFYSQYTIA